MRKHHRWSQEDQDILRENVIRYGWAEGCKTTAEEIGVTVMSCSSMCHKMKYTTTTTQPLESKVFKEARTRHFVTAEEEIEIADYLREYISKNPSNLTEIFRKCAEHFGVSQRTISHRWYGHKIGKTDYSTRPSCKKNIGIIYATVGQNTIVNGKQTVPTAKKTSWILAILRKAFKKDK